MDSQKNDRLIFHVDVNSAFLSWEAARRVRMGQTDLRLIPSCIGGDPKSRTGIVLAKSIPAKAYGIETGEPMSAALRKCPQLVSFPADFRLYTECSAAFKSICASYAPAMESFSIDEVFLDMTGTGRIYPDPVGTAHEIKDRIRRELGFTVNIGIGTNKLLAKMASDFEKPDRVHTLFPEEIQSKMWPLPVRSLLYLGQSSARKLTEAGLCTIGDLALADTGQVMELLGKKAGRGLQRYARGLDDDPVRTQREEAKGYSTEMTVQEDLVSTAQAYPLLLGQCDIVAARMRRDGKKCRCVSVTIRTLDFKTRSHQRKIEGGTDVTDEIFALARELLGELWHGQPLRLLGVSLTGLTEEAYEQLSLFDDGRNREKQKRLDQTMDELRARFGTSIVKRASTMGTSERVAKKAQAQMNRNS